MAMGALSLSAGSGEGLTGNGGHRHPSAQSEPGLGPYPRMSPCEPLLPPVHSRPGAGAQGERVRHRRSPLRFGPFKRRRPLSRPPAPAAGGHWAAPRPRRVLPSSVAGGVWDSSLVVRLVLLDPGRLSLAAAPRFHRDFDLAARGTSLGHPRHPPLPPISSVWPGLVVNVGELYVSRLGPEGMAVH